MDKRNQSVSDREIEILAHRLLPEIKKFFADEKIRKEFREWQSKQENNNQKVDKINYT